MLIVGAGLAFSAIAVFLTWSALRKGRAVWQARRNERGRNDDEC
jgi:hypothetical protein